MTWIFIPSRRGVAGGGGSGSSTTWNPSETEGTLSGGDLVLTNTGSGKKSTRATNGATGSKRYCEINVGTGTDYGNTYFGVSRNDISFTLSSGALLMRGQGSVFTGGSTGATFIAGSITYTSGDVLLIAVDTTSGTAANRKVWFGKNGTWANGDPAAGTGGCWHSLTDAQSWKPFIWRDGTTATSTFTLNCGAVSFTYTPPSGFSAF